MDTQYVQDLLPGTGSMGSVPLHHNYKRAVIRSAPKSFTVETLPPKKFGNGHCYGLRILPLIKDHPDDRSTKTGNSNIEYEVWRRWEDCLWFQDLLETEYKIMARTKRTRLAAGKGIKKDGVYIHSDRAASFDSLPPGPDANDIAKDIHDILPRLTKKGTLFRAGQATIDQRSKEFYALIGALFHEDVPTLIAELRDNRIIRDFFGYWRRDKDHDRKINEGVSSKRVSRASVSSSAFSMYFSSSNISLSLPNAFSDIPPSPSLPHSVKESTKGKQVVKAASFSSSSSSGSTRSPQTPVSAPVGMSFTVTDAGTLVPTSPLSDDESYFGRRGGPSSAPLRPSARWSHAPKSFSSRGGSVSDGEEGPIMFIPDTPWTESFGECAGGLQALPEEQELSSPIESIPITVEELPPPVRRPRNNSCPDPGNRNGLIFVTPPHASEPVDRDTICEIDGTQAEASLSTQPSRVNDPLPKMPLTNSNSSRHTSMALSSFSGEFSRRSSWRTSVASDSSVLGLGEDLSTAFEQVLCSSPVSTESPLLKGDPTFHPSHWPRSSVTTMNSIISNSSVDAVLPRRPVSPPQSTDPRRSLSVGSCRSSRMVAPTLSAPTEEPWYEQQEDLIDAYFYDPGLRASLIPPVSGYETVGKERVSQVLSQQISTPERFPRPFQNRPPGQFHLPWTPVKSSHYSVSSLSPTSSTSGDSFTIKAIRQDTIVLLRATYSMSLLQLRDRIRDKFASQEGPQLTDAFTIGFQPLPSDHGRSQKKRPRSQSTSSVNPSSQPRLRFITSETDWEDAISVLTGKLTLHIFDRF